MMNGISCSRVEFTKPMIVKLKPAHLAEHCRPLRRGGGVGLKNIGTYSKGPTEKEAYRK